MMRTLFLVIIGIFLCQLTIAQLCNISYSVNDLQQPIEDQFEIYLLYSDSSKKVIIKPTIIGCATLFPSINNDINLYLIFKHKKRFMLFSQVNVSKKSQLHFKTYSSYKKLSSAYMPADIKATRFDILSIEGEPGSFQLREIYRTRQFHRQIRQLLKFNLRNK